MSPTATTAISAETRQAIRQELGEDRIVYQLPPPTDTLYAQSRADFFAAAVRVGWPLVIVMFAAIIGAAWLQFSDDMHGWDGQVWWSSIAVCSLLYAIVLPGMHLKPIQRVHVPVCGISACLFLASQLASAMLIKNERFAQELTYVCMINNFSAMLAWGLPPFAGAITCLMALPIATLVALSAGVVPDFSMVLIYHLGSILVLFMVAMMLDRAERLGFLRELLLKHEFDENNRLIGELDVQNAELAGTLRDLKSTQAQLVQSEKMASLGQMIAGVAHEVNTPLGYVKNNVAVMQEFMGHIRTMLPATVGANDKPASGMLDFDDPAQLMDDLEMALGDTVYGIDQISQLVLGLKDFSRLDQARVESVSLNQCVESSLVLTKHMFKGNVMLVKQLGDIPTVPCAPSQINQVLLNLIGNAVQAMPQGGTVTIGTGSNDKGVFVTVADTGKGMSAEVRQHIFDPFYTTKPVGEGTGLGLSIVYQIVEQHSGSITVDSQEGVGSCFTVTIPRQNSIADVVAPAIVAA
jgi:signal transduction histidine kinase